MNNPRLKDKDIKYIRDLINEGKNIKWIAEHMNITESTISNICSHDKTKSIDLNTVVCVYCNKNVTN